MKIFAIHIITNTLELIRSPASVFLTLLLPISLMLIFKDSFQNDPLTTITTMIIFANFIVQTLCLQVLGTNVSTNRHSKWMHYIKTLPIKTSTILLSQISAMLIYALISLFIFFIIGQLIFGAYIPTLTIITIICFALIGGIPMAFLGITIGNLIAPNISRGLLLIINMLLLLAVILIPTEGLFPLLRELTPSHQWVMITINQLFLESKPIIPWLWLIAYTALFYLFAHWSFRRISHLRGVFQ